MRSYDYARESTRVFDDGNRVNFFKPLVDDTSTSDVRETCSATIALSVTALSPAHVQPAKLKEGEVSAKPIHHSFQSSDPLEFDWVLANKTSTGAQCKARE